jgi:hypothetical protein
VSSAGKGVETSCGFRCKRQGHAQTGHDFDQ